MDLTNAEWRKSSFSFSNGNCAEVSAWRTSTHSAAGNCAEVAAWRKSSASVTGQPRMRSTPP